MPGSEGWNGLSSERPPSAILEDYPHRESSRQDQYVHREDGGPELSSKLDHSSAYYGSSGGDRLTEAELAFRREREFEERERERDREYAREKQRERERGVRELHRDREAREDEETREFARREPNANNKRALSGSPDLPGSYAQHAHAQQRYDDDKGALMKELGHPANGSSRAVGGSMGNGMGGRDRDRDEELSMRNGIGAGSGNGSVPGGPMDSALVVSRNGGGDGGTAVELPTKSLFEAITQNDVREIQLIIASGEDIDAMLPEADTIAIILASKLCFNGIMELLIRGHANLDSQDRKGWTALHWTAVMNNIEGLSLLLNAGANIQARTQAGKSPLDLATIKDHDHAINFLQRHMDPNRQDLDGDGRDRVVRSCIECGSTKTPQWRRGPDGSVCLCNACGLRHIKSSKKKAKAAQKPGEQTQGLLPSQVPTQQAQAQQAQAQQAQAQAQAQQAQQRNMPGGLGMGGMGMGPMHDSRSPQPRYPMGSPGAPGGGRPRYQGSFSGDTRANSGPPDHLGYMGQDSRANGHPLSSYHLQQLGPHNPNQQQQRDPYRQYQQGGGSQGGYY